DLFGADGLRPDPSGLSHRGRHRRRHRRRDAGGRSLARPAGRDGAAAERRRHDAGRRHRRRHSHRRPHPESGSRYGDAGGRQTGEHDLRGGRSVRRRGQSAPSGLHRETGTAVRARRFRAGAGLNASSATFLRSSPLYSGRHRPFYARNSKRAVSPMALPAPLKKRLPLIVAGVVGLGLIVGGVVWWQGKQRCEGTDNAFVQADTVAVSPRIGGEVVEVLVKDNQRVEAGQILVRLDDADARAALAQAQANLAALDAAVANVDARAEQEQANIAARAAAVTQAQAQSNLARAEVDRYGKLADQ